MVRGIMLVQEISDAQQKLGRKRAIEPQKTLYF